MTRASEGGAARRPGTVWAVPLPAGAEPPYRVYVNGEELAEGEDFSVAGGELRLVRPLRPRPPLGLARKLMLAIGIGVYGDLRGDQLDLSYREDGQPRLLAQIPLTREAGTRRPPGD